ncbi:ssDNA endodeoxyribonuclease [Sticta canariensis]|nr:ssDNA endodeoxyribonuclease [Sticta canariensis]
MRPLPQYALQYASQDVQQLLELAQQQKGMLGALCLPAVKHLSAVNAEWFFDEPERHFSKRSSPAEDTDPHHCSNCYNNCHDATCMICEPHRLTGSCLRCRMDDEGSQLSQEFVMSVDIPNLDVSFEPQIGSSSDQPVMPIPHVLQQQEQQSLSKPQEGLSPALTEQTVQQQQPQALALTEQPQQLLQEQQYRQPQQQQKQQQNQPHNQHLAASRDREDGEICPDKKLSEPTEYHTPNEDHKPTEDCKPTRADAAEIQLGPQEEYSDTLDYVTRLDDELAPSKKADRSSPRYSFCLSAVQRAALLRADSRATFSHMIGMPNVEQLNA